MKTPAIRITRDILDLAEGKGRNPRFDGAVILLSTSFFFHPVGGAHTPQYEVSAHFHNPADPNGRSIVCGGYFESLDGVRKFLETGSTETAVLDLGNLDTALAKLREEAACA